MFACAGTMPAAMGLALASYVICQCAGQPIKVKALQSNITDGLIHKLYVRLENTERKESGIEYVDADRRRRDLRFDRMYDLLQEA
jgi:hypothetical protein